MRRFKKLFLAVIFSLLFVNLTSCITVPVYKNHEVGKEELSSVQIYDLREYKSEGSSFLTTMSPAYTVKEDELDRFLEDLSAIQFSDVDIIFSVIPSDPSFSFDEWTVRLNYTNGSSYIFSCDGYGERYDADGNVIECDHFSCDNDEWNEFIGCYVPSEIFHVQTDI